LTCLVIFVLYLLYLAFTFLYFSHDISSSRSESVCSRRSASISLLCVMAGQGISLVVAEVSSRVLVANVEATRVI
jgi:hypothetical protein